LFGFFISSYLICFSLLSFATAATAVSLSPVTCIFWFNHRKLQQLNSTLFSNGRIRLHAPNGPWSSQRERKEKKNATLHKQPQSAPSGKFRQNIE
jgi:hypothetical protein